MDNTLLTVAVIGMALSGVFLIWTIIRKQSARKSLSTPGGMTEVCSVGDKGERKMATDDEIKLVDCSEETRQFDCGHEGPVSFNYNIYGHNIETDKEEVAKSEQCGACLVADMKTAIIQCCLCGQPIMPCSPVALYGGGKGIRKKWTTRHKGKAIGCLGGDCCPSGSFFGGIWTGETVDSPFGNEKTVADAVFTPDEKDKK